MSLKKQYFKTKSTCKVTFRLPADLAMDAKKASVVGDFNKWNPKKGMMKKLKSGEFTAVIEIEKDNEYQFRYFLDEKRWINDPSADKYVPNDFGEENSVVVV